ncbi:serine hydrolase domain-containing protein [Bacillus sp. 1P06AnD]|uniref:serine hydrolase domain-containing protein n=1 Tax=Bacillus sp. 1P06AnD TaxID=3132208 RepID=UPI0039A28A2B
MIKTCIHSFIEQQEEPFHGNIVVSRKGQIDHRESLGFAERQTKEPNTSSHVFRIGSVTKTLTAMAILRLKDSCGLSLSDCLSTYVPAFPNGGRITIGHLLNHMSGIGNVTAQPDFLAKSIQYRNPDELVQWIASLPIESRPGETFAYNNSGYILLGKVIEVCTGMEYGTFMDQCLFKPLNMNNTGLECSGVAVEGMATGYELSADRTMKPAAYIDMSNSFSAGALFSTVDDLFSLNRALEVKSLLKEETHEWLFEKQEQLPYKAGWFKASTEAGSDLFFHHGGINGFTSSLMRLPRKEIAVIALSNASSLLTSTMAAAVIDYMDRSYE